MQTTRVLKVVYICLGVTSVLYFMWFTKSEFVLKLVVPKNSRISQSSLTKSVFEIDASMLINQTANKKEKRTLVILDYSGVIKHVKSDYYIGNCLITKNHSLLERADAIVIASRKLKNIQALPKSRKTWQRWVWFIDESPYHGVGVQPFKLADFKNVYNWTMTYRTNSDVYVPYGWTTRKSEPAKTVPDLGKRDKLVSAVISNCIFVHNYRMKYIKQLQKTVPVEVFGLCGKLTCNGTTTHKQCQFCKALSNSLFYLAFENANCKEYITEKLFCNGFESGAVPVVMGASKEDYTKIAPPNSFIHVWDFESAQTLGEYLTYLANNRTAYMQFHEWRKEYTTISRMQYTSKSVWEPFCEKLSNDRGVKKVISDLSNVWTRSDCNERLYW